MSRTTLDIDPSVLKQLRQRGHREGKSMGQVASELLARALGGEESEVRREPARWETWNLGVPLVDLEDKEALHSTLDRSP